MAESIENEFIPRSSAPGELIMFGIGGTEFIFFVICGVLILYFRNKKTSSDKMKDGKPVVYDEKYNDEYNQHKELGLSLWSQGDKKEAVNELEKALKAKPDCVETWCKLGDWYDFLSCSDFMASGANHNALRQKAISAL